MISHSQKTRKMVKKIYLGMVAPLKPKAESDFLLKATEGFLSLGFDLSIIAQGDSDALNCFFDLQEKSNDSLHILEDIEKNREEIMENTQIMIFMEKPEKKVLKKISENGIIALIPSVQGLDKNLINFDPQKEEGNCFLYDEGNFWDFFATMIRAYETFKFPYDWGNLRKTVKTFGKNL